MQEKPLSSTSCKSLSLLTLHKVFTASECGSLNSLCDSVFLKSDEWGGPHVAHYWKQRGGNSGEEHPLSDVGYRRTGVAPVLLEHLLLQHRGEQRVLDTFLARRGTEVLSSSGYSGSWYACSEHRRQQGPPKSEVSLSQRRAVWKAKRGSASAARWRGGTGRVVAEADVLKRAFWFHSQRV